MHAHNAPPPGEPFDQTPDDDSAAAAAEAVAARLATEGPDLLGFAARAVHRHPTDPLLLQLAAVAALCEERPDDALRFLKRIEKRYIPTAGDHVIRALALAQRGRREQARRLLVDHGIANPQIASYALNCPNRTFARQARTLLKGIFKPATRPTPASNRAGSGAKASGTPTQVRAKAKATPRGAPPPGPGPSGDATVARASPLRAEAQEQAPAAPATHGPHPLSPEVPTLSIRFQLPSADDVGAASLDGDVDLFDLRRQLAELGLARTFEELLCLPTLRSVDTYWYQVETVRKVLKQFRGRVLLADEVGLGKTIEAGMIVKEYLMRGMARRVLVLTPAALVGQWREELCTKFDLDFATTRDAALRRDPEAFWRQPLIVASIAVARRPRHAAALQQGTFDIVVVDEAHHLKNQRTRGYALVNALQKRFLVLMSATPVQNNLLELYNLLTLLKPGIFRTQKDFRAAYMTPGKPRLPANHAVMRDLMRDVMIRNTRALVDVRLPARHAVTLRPQPADEEAHCYRALAGHVRALAGEARGETRLALRSLLAAAGSSPHAAAAALRRFVERRGVEDGAELRDLAERYARIGTGAKEGAFLDLIARNPGERTMVFSHHLATLDRLAGLLGERGFPFARFDGSLSGQGKDEAIVRFRDEVPILLSTESGGEGRNVQFANTLVNFDLPWNPMTLEQRIGRLHRIGQTRDVFIFNLATRGTVEDRLLRVLDDKINMFELVVGEIGDILGEIDDERNFADAVFAAWIASSDAAGDSEAEVAEVRDGFAELEREMLRARQRHAEAKSLDEALFGDDFEAA